MSKRMVVMLIGAAVFVGTIGSVKFRQIRTATAQAASFRMPPEAVTTSTARQEEWPATLNAIGSATAVHGVTVTADLSGIVEAITFDSGQTVEAGQVLVRLDTRQEQAQLAAAEAQSELTRLNLERTKGLFDQGIVAKAEFDRATAEEKQAEARVGEIRATIERKQIRAPFTGQVKERLVTQGQYLKVQAPVMVIVNIDPLRARFKVPERVAGWVSVGQPVTVTVEAYPGRTFTGKIARLSPSVDTQTRTLEVEALLDNPESLLKPGFFAKAKVASAQVDTVLMVPHQAVRYIFGVYKVFTVEGHVLKEKEVRVGERTGDEVEIVSGLDAKQQVAVPAEGQEPVEGAPVEATQ